MVLEPDSGDFVLLKKLTVDTPQWSNSDKYARIEAIVQIRFSCADDFICDIAGSCVLLETVEIGHWDRFTIEEACELIGCSRFKLGELFMEEAESHVYQALTMPRSGFPNGLIQPA